MNESDEVVHARVKENQRRRAEARREQDERAEDPKVRMLRCYEQEPDPDPPEIAA